MVVPGDGKAIAGISNEMKKENSGLLFFGSMSIVGVGLHKSPTPSCVFEVFDCCSTKQRCHGMANKPPNVKIVTGLGCSSEESVIRLQYNVDSIPVDKQFCPKRSTDCLQVVENHLRIGRLRKTFQPPGLLQPKLNRQQLDFS